MYEEAFSNPIKAAEYGIEVVEVRIKRTDLPPEIANSILGEDSITEM